MIARLIAQLESFQWKLRKEQLSALNGRKIARWIQLWKCIDLYVKAIARKRWTQCESHSVGSLSRILRYFAFIEKQPHSTSWTLAVAQIPTIRQNHLGKTKNAKRIKPISRRIVAADWAICFAMSVARASLVQSNSATVFNEVSRSFKMHPSGCLESFKNLESRYIPQDAQFTQFVHFSKSIWKLLRPINLKAL